VNIVILAKPFGSSEVLAYPLLLSLLLLVSNHPVENLLLNSTWVKYAAERECLGCASRLDGHIAHIEQPVKKARDDIGDVLDYLKGAFAALFTAQAK
jgi:hypothetical protein